MSQLMKKSKNRRAFAWTHCNVDNFTQPLHCATESLRVCVHLWFSPSANINCTPTQGCTLFFLFARASSREEDAAQILTSWLIAQVPHNHN